MLAACLTFTRISVHGAPERPTFEPEADVYCGRSQVLTVGEVESANGSWIARPFWGLERTGEFGRVTRLQYGEVPEGWKRAEGWLPDGPLRPLVAGTLYAVELSCGRDRGLGVFELVPYSGGLRLRNLDREEVTRRVAASPAGSSPARR